MGFTIKMDKKTANILYVILIIAVIGFLIFMVVWLKSEGGECAKNPINYFKEKNPDITCYCYQGDNMVEGLITDQP